MGSDRMFTFKFQPWREAAMPNQLKLAMLQGLLALHQQGWSQRRIARQLGVNRETVGRYLAQWRAAAAKPAIPHTGSDIEIVAKPAIVHTGSPEQLTAESAELLLVGLPLLGLGEAGPLPGRNSECARLRD